MFPVKLVEQIMKNMATNQVDKLAFYNGNIRNVALLHE